MMNNMHNLGTVIRFEVTRTLKKPSFWLMALGFPVMMAAIFGVVFLSNQATMDAADKLKDQKFSIAVADESGIIKPEVLNAVNAELVATRAQGIEKVQSGQVEAFFYYPKDLATHPVEVFGEDIGVFDNSRYSSVATMLLDQSVSGQVAPDQLAVFQGRVSVNLTMTRCAR
jgi:ABC-2 type transport system permease protein